MKDPLRKRFPRELKEEAGKYLVIFILMVFSIALQSGYIVGGKSMIKAYDDSFEKYNIEDGNFSVKKKMNKSVLSCVEGYGIKVYENFYVTLKDDNNKEYRLFRNRSEVNRIDVLYGRLPEGIDEIALDRAFCDNNHLELGDEIVTREKTFTPVGKVALSDYSTMFASNDDMMFDAVNFTIALVSDECFDSFKDVTYNYAYKYNEAPEDTSEEKEMADALSKNLSSQVVLDSFTPRYLNRAINFTGSDMGSDQGMMAVLFYMIIVIMAFVFAVTAANTIEKEMTVIGTLLASGYTKKELIIHYMTLPFIVTLISAFIGNVVGYTWIKNAVVDLYYNSYSLPTYTTIWSPEAFLKTTLLPIGIMVAINLFILIKKLNMPIMNFLRRQTSSSANRRAFPLSKKIPFISRYRLRIFFKNIPSYLVMLVGIIFANLLILFGLDFPQIIDDFEAEMLSNPIAPYITMLKLPESMKQEDHKLENGLRLMEFYNAVNSEEDVEKFSAYVLKTLDDPSMEYEGERITIYGVEEDSKYIHADFSDHQIYASEALADKFRLKKGDVVTLKEEYEEKQYAFEIDGSYDYLGSLSMFMSRSDLNALFDMDKDTFVGYFSDKEIGDIEEEYVASIIDVNVLTKMSRQLRVSFGGMMDMVIVFAVVIYVVVIYILSKMMIDSSAQSISMSKIMGYSNLEIASLYIVTTSVAFVLLLLLSLPFEVEALKAIFRYMMISELAGWFPLTVSKEIIGKTIAIAIVSYVFVTVFELLRIARIPMDQALKNVE